MNGRALFEQFATLPEEERRKFLETLRDSDFCPRCGKDNKGRTMPCACDPYWDE